MPVLSLPSSCLLVMNRARILAHSGARCFRMLGA